MKPTTALCIVVAILSSSLFASDRPNILFIAIDDLNDWIGPLGGHPQTKTPNIDRLAARGMTFTNAHSPGMTCNASRTALMTGLRPATTGLYSNSVDWRKIEKLQNLGTLPRYFKKSGYRTTGAGKLFHASTWNLWAYFGYNDKLAWNSFFPSLDRQVQDEVMPHEVPARGTHPRRFDWSPVASTDFAMGDGQVAFWSAEQIRSSGDEPRFDAVGIYRPHLPWFLPRKYFEMHPLENIQLPERNENDLDDLPDSVLNGYEKPSKVGTVNRFYWTQEEPGEERLKQVTQAYLASVSFADAMVGHVLDALDDSGRADATIVVLWTDHGFHIGEKNLIGKSTLWRESTRVPLIVVAPGVTTPGSRSDTAVSLMDIYPTLTDLSGLETPEHIEGISLTPILKNPSQKSGRPALSSLKVGTHAVSKDRFRYLRYADGSEELYDIHSDPNEWTNLATDPAYESIKTEMKKWLPRSEAPWLESNRDASDYVDRVSDITLPLRIRRFPNN